MRVELESILSSPAAELACEPVAISRHLHKHHIYIYVVAMVCDKPELGTLQEHCQRCCHAMPTLPPSDAGCLPLQSGAMLLTEGQPPLHMLVSSEYMEIGWSPACCSMHCPKCTPAGITLLMQLHVAAFEIGKRPT